MSKTYEQLSPVVRALNERLGNLKGDLSELDDGKIVITKDVVWQNGYITNTGVIRNSSLSAFALVSLNAGETVKIGTANTNITIIGSTDAESLAVGDTVSVIATTTNSGAFEEYSYQAKYDMNIVLCVLKSNYACNFYKQSNFIKQIDDKFSDVFTITRKAAGSKKVNAIAGTYIAADASRFGVSLSADEEVSFYVKDPSNVIANYYLYVNDTSDYAKYLTNKEYFITLDQDTTRIGIYVESSWVVGDGIIECVVNKITRNTNSVEAKADDALETSQECAKYIPHGITDGYTYGSVVENGSFLARGTLSTGIENRIRTTLIPFKTGDKIVINNGTFVHGCGMWEGEPSASTIKRNDQSFISNGETITPDYDGYIVIVFKKSDDSNIVPTDYDGSILLYNTLAYRNSVYSNSSYTVPDYFLTNNYLLNKANRINELGQNADDVFFFITDVHWELNAKHSPDLIDYLSEKCNVPRLFDGGDLANGIIKSAIEAYRKHYKGSIFRTTGNHDWLAPTTGKNLYYAFDVLNNNQIGNAFEHYWYTENVQQKIRYVVLRAFKHEGSSSSEGWSSYDADQIDWFVNDALNVPNDWDVIVITHFVKTTGSYISGGDAIVSAIDAFNSDTLRTGRVLFILQGHTHWDGVYHTASGIPIITTTCDKYDISNEPELAQEVRTLGTINEHAFDVMILNRENKTVTAVRIGAPAQNNVDKYRTDSNFEWVGTLEERVISYD